MTPQKTAVELKGCPFCGSKASILFHRGSGTSKAQCDNWECPSKRNALGDEAATEAWNTRTQPAQSPPTVDEKCAVCEGHGYTVGTTEACCGNIYDHGECRSFCAVPEPFQEPCEACQTTGKNPAPPPTGDARKALDACDTIEHILAKNMRDEKECLIANVKCIRAALAPLPEVEGIDATISQLEGMRARDNHPTGGTPELIYPNSGLATSLLVIARNYRQRM